MSEVSLPADWYERAAAETYARELSNTTNILAKDYDVLDAGTRVEALFRSRNPGGVAVCCWLRLWMSLALYSGRYKPARRLELSTTYD